MLQMEPWLRENLSWGLSEHFSSWSYDVLSSRIRSKENWNFMIFWYFGWFLSISRNSNPCHRFAFEKWNFKMLFRSRNVSNWAEIEVWWTWDIRWYNPHPMEHIGDRWSLHIPEMSKLPLKLRNFRRPCSRRAPLVARKFWRCGITSLGLIATSPTRVWWNIDLNAPRNALNLKISLTFCQNLISLTFP